MLVARIELVLSIDFEIAITANRAIPLGVKALVRLIDLYPEVG